MTASRPRATGKRKPSTLTDACASGDQRLALEAMRDELATAMMEAPATVKAQIAARLQAVLHELAALKPAEKGNRIDEIAARRAARLAGADAAASSG